MKPYRTILAIATLAVVVACSEQGEGDRCIAANGNSDCGSGLICVKAQALEEWSRNVNAQQYVADRCCPVNQSPGRDDPRCNRKTNEGGVNGAAGGAPSDNTGGRAGGGAANESLSSSTASTEPVGGAESAGTAGAAGSSGA